LKHRHWPLSFLFFTGLGVVCFFAGIAALADLLTGLHPIFNDGMAVGLALVVSAIALILTGAFPLVLRRLAEREGA